MKKLDIPSKYDPTLTEDKWYSYWMDHGFFKSVPNDKEPYTIVIPPPNVTGVLHMGHMLNNTIQDILVRRARMLGYNACWVPGTDHASIATEARVVGKLAKEGIKKADLSRDEFLEHAWDWTHKHGGIILEQLKKLGASCDWDRTKFTMDDDMSESVIKVFVDLYNKGLIYRGVRMVNWDPEAKTAVSDEEVNHKELQSKLYYVKYQIENSDDFLTIATTRPETILGDTAVCVHPEDERYSHLKGKKIIIPLVNRVVPIIFDEYVDREFGTGALKITPAHDINDYELGLKHKLETIDLFTDSGTMSEAAGFYVGEDRFEVRELIVKDLENLGQVVKIEDYVNKVGFSERTDAVIEPKLSVQWFLNMKKLAEPALENVINDTIKLVPAKFKNTYKHWMENVNDWCISRQLWWGHRIPAYFLPNGDYVIAHDEEEALQLAREKANDSHLKAEDLKQDPDVLDTWFSSWLWPISVFDGIRNPENKDMQYYYPTNDLITAPEILFFWVARMVMAGYEYQGERPFNNVYLTGIVRDQQRRKMSKSLGNSPDPLKLIEKYGADGVRVGMLLCSPAGNDLLFDENLTEQGRNFGNKIWNAFRLIANWEVDESIDQPEAAKAAIGWFDEKLNQALELIDDNYSKYRLSDALMTSYKLFWDDFSSWFLEIIKPAYQKPIDAKTYEASLYFMEKLMKVLHPFMPFITEEIYSLIREREDNDAIMLSEMPVAKNYSSEKLAQFEDVKEVISFIRKTRKDKNISNSEELNLCIRTESKEYDHSFDAILKKLAHLEELQMVSEPLENAATVIVDTIEYFIPLSGKIDVEEEMKKLESELKYTEGFLIGVNKKLGNKRFVDNAPEKVVAMEQKKKTDAEAKIKALEEQINLLKQ